MASTLFTAQTPTLPNINEGVPVTVGNTVGFAVPGTIRSRFFAPTTLGSGTYELVLFQMTTADGGGGSGAGTQLATAPVSLGSLTGGQWSAWFSLGSVTATDTYVVGLRTSEGRYAATGAFWTAPIVSGDITGFQDGTSRPALGGTVYNGRFASGLVNFPASTFNSNGYFVDVEHTASAAPVSLADAAASADTLSVVATLALAETGSAAQALLPSAAIPLTDTGAGAQALAAAAAIGLADTGSAVQFLTAAVTVGLGDAGAAADAGAGNNGSNIQKAFGDTASAADRLRTSTVRPNSGITTRPTSGITPRP